MDIHKPKPWHGVREFLKEYVIVVIGVLTALGAEQAVEWLHWQHEVEVAREAITFDLRGIVGRSASKDGESACVAQRLGELADVLDQAQVSKRLPPMGQMGSPDTPPWTMRSWSGLTSGQTLAHIANRDQLQLSGIASYLEHLRAITQTEQVDWAVLGTMVGPGRPTSDAEIASLRAALGRAHWDAIYEKVGSRQVASLVARTDYLSPAQLDASFREGLVKAGTARLCRPPDKPPARSSDDFRQGPLVRPVIRPGDDPLPVTVGNAGALTTER